MRKMTQMSISTEAIFLDRTYLAVSTDIVTLPNLDTQATGFSMGEVRATVPQPMLYQIAPSKSDAAWTHPLCQGSEYFPYAADET